MDGPDTAGREHDEDEIWRDLVARLDVQSADENLTGPAPWPAQEDLDGRPLGGRVIKPADPDATSGEAAPSPADPVTDAAGEAEPAGPADGPGAVTDDEHYIPPPPPPLPQLDAISKGAWSALFGGPAYLLVATLAGWTIPAWAAFCGMAAFVGGFITLVVRMSDERHDDGSDPDDGAVV